MYYYIARYRDDLYDIGITNDESETMEKQMPLMFKVWLGRFAKLYHKSQLKHLTKYKVDNEDYYKLEKPMVEKLIKTGALYNDVVKYRM
ncbi:hypothetical protein [Choristoneura rosaceana nucleopolyhedrovirus]|uniref:Uncharacterized protein n=1 Tax=Choristoneura rosaceana nucleopolyhedrovirus TaxID=58094 RepID=S5MRD8_9ABAC|nr:hypothetical protein [Choristoneura rosaceana nucleopolyhedrovirus]AGR57159.1 hypothetical protein [Choristoneura rosaceana nucleopolyhedrovirus]